MTIAPAPAASISAQIRDEYGNRMPIAARIEFSIDGQCLAAFRSTSYDFELFDQYGTYGSSLLVFTGQKQLRILKRRFSYESHVELGKLDQFELGGFTFAELLRLVYYNGDEWRAESIDYRLQAELRKNGPAYPLSPIQFTYIIAQS